jgi:hypothetical protein
VPGTLKECPAFLVYSGFISRKGAIFMDEEIRDEEIRDEENDNDEREEETEDEIRDEDYREDDMIEMLKSIREELNILKEQNVSLKTAIAQFVDNGAVIRETDDISDTDDFADDFVEIEDMNLSLDERR